MNKKKDPTPEQGKEEANVPTTAQPAPPAIAEINPDSEDVLKDLSITMILSNPQVFGYLRSLAQIMASGTSTIPEHLRNEGDCMAVILQSAQWKMSPWAVAQKTHLINGTLGYEAQLVNAVVTTSGALDGKFDYEWFGPWENVIGKFLTKQSSKGNTYQVPGWSSEDEKGCGVRVTAILKGEPKARSLELLLSQASVRNSTLWASDPKQQLAYLAVKRWSRLYAPECILGVYTRDELEDMKPPMKNITPVGETQTEKLLGVLTDEKKPEEKPPVEEVLAEAEVEYKLPDHLRKQLFAVLAEQKINADYFKKGLDLIFGYKSTNNIPLEKHDEILDWIRAGCPDLVAR